MLTITDLALSKILELMKQEEHPESIALRVSIAGRGAGGFSHELQFVGVQERTPEDTVVDAGGVQVFVDAASAEHLKGATIDFVEGLYSSGFKIANPNPPWTDPTAQAVQDVIDHKINPGVAGHGGFVTLLDVKGAVAYISLGGGCQGCGMADVTLKQGIEVMIKEAVPVITQVVDTTDHAGGANPYYQPSKSGHSPLAD